MREKERARQERLQRKKEEKRDQKFTPPPIRLNKKERKSSSTPRTPSSLHEPMERKSSLSVGPSKKGLRVSWASSAATLDVDGHASEKSIETASKTSGNLIDGRKLPSIKFPFDTSSVASSIDTPTPIPRARTSLPRLSASIGARAPRGEEMIAITTPDVCESWSKPTDPFLNCRCWDSVDPLDTRPIAGCDVHR